MQTTVEGPGEAGVRSVPIGLTLWVGTKPVLEPRVLFFDRAKQRKTPAWPDGQVSLDGESWWLIAHDIEEEFAWAGQHWVRHRAQLWDERRDRIVGAFYWCVELGPWTEPT